MKKPRQFTGRWFRHYEEALNDPKILALSNKQFRFLINCWCLASKHGGVLPEMPELVKLVRIKTKEVAEMVATLRSGEEPLLDEIDGKLTPHNWHLRQFKSDFSAERMRKHRSKNSGDSAAEQQLNSSQSDAEQQDEIKATTTKRSDSTISRDGLVTAPDTYTDTDIVDIPTVVEVHTSPRNVQQTE